MTSLQNVNVVSSRPRSAVSTRGTPDVAKWYARTREKLHFRDII